MANINVTIRIDEDMKKEADELFDELGLSFTTAINIFVRQCLREGGIPFQISRSAQPKSNFEYAVLSDLQR